MRTVEQVAEQERDEVRRRRAAKILTDFVDGLAWATYSAVGAASSDPTRMYGPGVVRTAAGSRRASTSNRVLLSIFGVERFVERSTVEPCLWSHCDGTKVPRSAW